LRESVAKKKIPIFAIDPHESWAAQSLLREAGKTTDDLSLPLLLDPSLTVSASYGVLFQMNIHIEESSRPATFIVDREGVAALSGSCVRRWGLREGRERICDALLR